MKADTLTLKALFQKDVRYVIPMFQRPYVWTQDDQWEPLWEDVRNAAERYLDELAAADGNNAVAEERAGSHFMGAVVFQQQPTASAEIESRDIVDGQQRLTTMQVLIDAAQEALEDIGADTEANRLVRLVRNSFASGDQVFKLWPTAVDQDAFRAAMTNEMSADGFESSLIVQAHAFFRLQIREWIDQSIDEEERSSRVHGLETAIFGLLELVVIDLATADDAFVIFETLNARGTPLRAADLVKNFLLQTAASSGSSAEALYEDEWRPFEDEWWRADIRQGRVVRPRLDQFLNYWLTMRTTSEVQTHEVFPKFKAYVDDGPKAVVNVAHDVRKVGTAFRHLDEVEPLSAEGTFMYRWRTMDAGTSTPLLLWLFSQSADVLSPEARLVCLQTIETYLVRRMVCRMTTKDYNRLFLDLLARVDSAGSGDVAPELTRFLAGQSSESRVWPDDLRVSGALLDLPLYRLLTRGRLRMVLEALEDTLRTPLTEEAHVERQAMTIEHILPQSWMEHWPLLDGGNEHEAVIERERLLHSIGNLTLVNGKLNPAMSNSGWVNKRGALAQHSVLHLNKELLRDWGSSDFDEVGIKARGALLADRFCAVWPAAPGISATEAT